MEDKAPTPPKLDDFLTHSVMEDEPCENCAAASYSEAICEHIAALGEVSGLGAERIAFHSATSILAWMVETGYDADDFMAKMRERATELMSEERFAGGTAGNA